MNQTAADRSGARLLAKESLKDSLMLEKIRSATEFSRSWGGGIWGWLSSWEPATKAAVVGGLFLLTNGFLFGPPRDSGTASGTSEELPAKDREKSPLESETVAIEQISFIPQPVNSKTFYDRPRTYGSDAGVLFTSGDKELSTMEVQIRNDSDRNTTIESAEFVVRSVESSPDGAHMSSTVALRSLINHAGHIVAPVRQPRIGEPIGFAVHRTVSANSTQSCTIWFKCDDPWAPEVRRITGHLRLFASDGFADSRELVLEFHSETQRMGDKPVSTSPNPYWRNLE